MSACPVPVVYPDLDDTQRFVPEPKPEPAPDPTCPPPPRRRMSAIQMEVGRRLNDPTWGARERMRFPAPRKAEQVEEVERFTWDRSKTLAIAAVGCVHCMGLGLKGMGRKGEMQPCGCVLRKAFNSVLGRYRYIQAHQDLVSSCTPTVMKNGHESKRVWSRKNEEFCADFYLVSKRTLHGYEWKIFKLHMLDGNDWRYCTRILGMDRGNFFHSVYRIQQKLGRVFMELQPYALFPIDEYFGGVRSETAPVCKQHGAVNAFRAPIRRQVEAFA